MEFPADPGLPDDFTPLARAGDLAASSRARRRRARRGWIPPADAAQAPLLDDLAQSTFPSLGFFLLALACGLLMGAGYLLDSHALLLLALLAAPLLAPWMGMTLAAVTGGWRFFFQTIASLLIAFLLAFLSSSLVGLLARILEFSRFNRAVDHSKLWWTDLFIIVLGAVLLVLAHMRGTRKPILPSLMLAYGFFLPIGAAGFAWGAGLPGNWQDGLLVFLTYFSLATLIGCIVLRTRRIKAARKSGNILLTLVVILCLAALVVFTGLAGWISDRASPVVTPFAPTPLSLVSPTPGLPPPPTFDGPTSTATKSPTAQPSASATITPEPTYAVIAASTGGGALVRSEPGAGIGSVLTTLINGSIVEVLSETRAVGTIQWVLIRTSDGIEGWVVQDALAILTPESPGASSLTPAP